MSLRHCFVAGLVGSVVGGGLGAYLSQSFLGALSGGVALGGLFAGTYLYSRKKRDTRTMSDPSPASMSNGEAAAPWTGDKTLLDENKERRKKREELEQKKQEELYHWGKTSGPRPGDYDRMPGFENFAP